MIAIEGFKSKFEIRDFECHSQAYLSIQTEGSLNSVVTQGK